MANETEFRLDALEYQVGAIQAQTPNRYYTSRWSGEEIDALLGGRSLVISGVYPSLSALQAAFPNGASGAYQTSDDRNLYVWNSTTRAWENLGQLQGPAGQKGTSIQDIKRTAGNGAPGTRDTYTITLTDGTQAFFQVYNGADGNIADTEAAKKAAQQAIASAQTARSDADRAQAARESIEVDAAALDKAVQSAQGSSTAAQSWAVGGTGSRPGEDEDNARYYANKAQAEADRATVPAVAGLYNLVLQDRDTGERYALIVEDSTLKLLGVSDTLDATRQQLIDTASGTAYELVVESGTLKLEEAE